MNIFSSRRLFAFGVVVLLAVNIAVLAGVAVNRRGEPEARVTLTQRELQLPYQVQRENSGLSLRIVWRSLAKSEGEEFSYYGANFPAWLDAGKLQELGFDLDAYDDAQLQREQIKEPIPREVLVVLEMDGDEYREAVRRAEAALTRHEQAWRASSDVKELHEKVQRAEERLRRERIADSRLFAVDAGLDLETLRRTYPDRSRFLIARGLVQPILPADRKSGQISGSITGLSVENIHVPLSRRKIFDAALAVRDRSRSNDPVAPSYKVELAYGSRLEPWIAAVTELAEH